MITVRLFAAARAAAGTAEVHVPAGPASAVILSLAAGRPERFGRVLSVSSLVCDGTRLDPTSGEPIPDGAVVDVLPPFAGG